MIIGLFTDLRSVDPLEEFLEGEYDPGEYNLTWIFAVIFPALHDCMILVLNFDMENVRGSSP
jgi:hypothetical protein